MSRWTKKETDAFTARWLRERMGHKWTGPEIPGPTRCALCRTKFAASRSKVLLHPRACPKRRRPNRWRVHLKRAMHRAQYPPQPPIKRDGAWILNELRELERWAKDLRYDSSGHRRPVYRTDEGQWWKFSRDARRYRKLLAEWWALPNNQVRAMPTPATPDRWSGTWTRKRNELIKRAKTEQRREYRDGECTYTLYPNATDRNGQLIFTEA